MVALQALPVDSAAKVTVACQPAWPYVWASPGAFSSARLRRCAHGRVALARTAALQQVPYAFHGV